MIKKYLCVNETVSSAHDTHAIQGMLSEIQYSYLKVTNATLKFRLVMVDHSWASYHAINKALNDNESILDYAERVYQLSKKVRIIL